MVTLKGGLSCRGNDDTCKESGVAGLVVELRESVREKQLWYYNIQVLLHTEDSSGSYKLHKRDRLLAALQSNIVVVTAERLHDDGSALLFQRR